MPLQPNLIERQLIKRGLIPGLLLDGPISLTVSHAVIAALELRVFEYLEENPLGVDELAERIDGSEEGISNLVRVLTRLGYLKETDEGYQLTTSARRSLPEGDHHLIGVFAKEMGKQGMDASRAVTDAPREGIIGWETVQSGEVGEGYQETMRWLASDLVDPVVDSVSLPSEANRMLDIGGSHGLYTVRFCEKHPNLEGDILDWEIGLESARQTLEEKPYIAERIELIERDFEEEELPEGYDFVFLGNIVHGLSPEGNKELFNKISDSTTDNGVIGILDQVEPPEGNGLLPFNPFESSFADGISALIGFNLFLFSGGRTYPYDELKTWLNESGFTEVNYIALKQSPGFSLITAKKK